MQLLAKRLGHGEPKPGAHAPCCERSVTAVARVRTHRTRRLTRFEAFAGPGRGLGRRTERREHKEQTPQTCPVPGDTNDNYNASADVVVDAVIESDMEDTSTELLTYISVLRTSRVFAGATSRTDNPGRPPAVRTARRGTLMWAANSLPACSRSWLNFRRANSWPSPLRRTGV